MMATIASTLTNETSGDGMSREDILANMAKDMEGQCPDVFDIQALQKMYPVLHEQCMNTVLVQEALRYNKMLVVIKKSLSDIQKAIRGEVVMNKELEDMGKAMFTNVVPSNWEAV